MSLKESLEAKVKKIEEDFNKAAERVKTLIERRAEIDRELAALREDQLRMQGAHQEMKALMETDVPESKGTPTIN